MNSEFLHRRNLRRIVITLLLCVLTAAFFCPAVASAKTLKFRRNRTYTCYIGGTYRLKKSGSKDCTWKSSDRSVASVGKRTGKLKLKKPGTVTITVRYGRKRARCRLSVLRPYLNLTEYTVYECGSFALGMTGTNAVKWRSSDRNVAVVTKQGVVTGRNAGTATITCTGKDRKKYRCVVTVISPVLSDTQLRMAVGDTHPLVLSGMQTVGWQSSAPAVAAVDRNGLVTALAGGDTVITCTGQNGKPYTCSVHIVPNEKLRFIAHRGYSALAPENTLASFRLAYEKGYQYVECDVRFTKDGVPVLLHDSTIDRTSDGSGAVAALTFDEVRAYDFGSWKSAAYQGERIPSFEEFLSLCVQYSLHPYIELKGTDRDARERAAQLLGMVRKYGLSGNVTWISFTPSWLDAVRSLDAGAGISYLVNELTQTQIAEAAKYKSGAANVSIGLNYRYYRTAGALCAGLARNAGLGLEIWTADNAADILTFDPYVSAVTTNRVTPGEL